MKLMIGLKEHRSSISYQAVPKSENEKKKKSDFEFKDTHRQCVKLLTRLRSIARKEK